MVNALDSMMTYASFTDCDAKSSFTSALANRAYNYLNTATQNRLNGLIPDEPAT
jgi:hypothetical protein